MNGFIMPVTTNSYRWEPKKLNTLPKWLRSDTASGNWSLTLKFLIRAALLFKILHKNCHCYIKGKSDGIIKYSLLSVRIRICQSCTGAGPGHTVQWKSVQKFTSKVKESKNQEPYTIKKIELLHYAIYTLLNCMQVKNHEHTALRFTAQIAQSCGYCAYCMLPCGGDLPVADGADLVNLDRVSCTLQMTVTQVITLVSATQRQHHV